RSAKTRKERLCMLYSHVLVAVDLIDECRAVADHAQQLARALGAKLTVLHVVEPLAMSYGGDVPMDLSMLQQQQFEQARERMQLFAGDYGLPEEQMQIAFGHPCQEIHRVATEFDCDLIVVGSHRRCARALLLGSTANDVLHGAPCDVIAVRLNKTENTSSDTTLPIDGAAGRLSRPCPPLPPSVPAPEPARPARCPGPPE